MAAADAPPAPAAAGTPAAAEGGPVKPAVPQSGSEPPAYVEGEYLPAADGWLAHKGGQWLYNPTDKAYFHLATGQLHLAPADGLLVTFAGAAARDEEGLVTGGTGDPAAKPLRGSVRWYNVAKGFGFIEPSKATRARIGSAGDIFFHRNQIRGEEKMFRAPRPGTQVTFSLGETDNGRQCAVDVHVVVVAAEDEAAEPRAKRPRTEGQEVAGGGAEAEEAEEAENGDGGSDAESGSSVEIDLFEELKSGLANEKGPAKDRCEDFAVDKAKLPISVLGESATCVFFAVFDGHGGTSCAEYCASHLAKNILARLRDRPKNVNDEAFLRGGLLGGFKQTEHNYLQHAKRVDDRAGSTACTMTVFGPDDESRLRLFLANAGDSRAVLGKIGGEAVRLTTDHKPNLPEEKRRIEGAGGGVAEIAGIWRCMLPRNRVSPILGLAVSRAFGDKDFKGPDIVTAEPDITVHDIDWDNDEFVILGSDGIWDVVTDKDAVRIVQQCFKEGGSEEKAAQALIAKALEKGSNDDRTALVVRFGWCKASSAAAARPEKAADNDAADNVPGGARPGGGAATAEGAADGLAGPPASAAAAAAVAEEEEDEENDPEVAAAIRAAMGLDDDDDEDMEEEEAGEEEAEEEAATNGAAVGSRQQPHQSPTATAPGPAAAGATAAPPNDAPTAASSSSASGVAPRGEVAAAAAPRAASPPPAAGAGAAPRAEEPRPPKANDATAQDAAGAAADMDDIFAGGLDNDGEDGQEAEAGRPLGANGPSLPVGMGLFDGVALPAPAEEEGPALVGPRRPGEA